MKTFLYSIPTKIQTFSKKLDVKAVLCGKSWEVFNDEGVKQLFIFNEDGTVLITNNGKVYSAVWKFIPQNSSILLTTSDETIMFRPAFFNKDVFALQQDGTERYLLMIDEDKKPLFQTLTLDTLTAYIDKEIAAISNEKEEKIRQRQIEQQKEEDEIKKREEEKEREAEEIKSMFIQNKELIEKRMEDKRKMGRIGMFISGTALVVTFLLWCLNSENDTLNEVFLSMGGITNSLTILEQMTYLFFMKMLDDSQTSKEAAAGLFGGTLLNPTFLPEKEWHNPETDRDVPYESLRWHVFKNYEAEKMFNTVRNDVFVFIKNLGGATESAYSRFMQNAVFLIQNPRTLVRVVDGINELDMNNRDTMGDVYEYILGKMAASGTNGQFRTPRHIIRMMVNLMKPTLKDEICDPAMGSAGFIVESAKYIQEHYRKELLKNENSDWYRTGMFHGFDTDTTMLRIGAMNLMLHGVDEPDIKWQDSVSDQNTDTNKYTLCLANPPFAGSVDGQVIAKTLTAIAPTKKTELLFLALFVRMLRTGGRCASIVPDGVLFGNSSAHQAIRKELIDHQRLQAVISMPSGVFQPYSGVSTAILVFTKTNAGGTDKVWFYDMKADGFSLDQKRTEVPENDIPDVIARFNDLPAEEARTRKDKSFLVPVDEIRANDYVLSMNKYKEVEREVVEYENPDVILGRIDALESEITAALKVFREKFL